MESKYKQEKQVSYLKLRDTALEYLNLKFDEKTSTLVPLEENSKQKIFENFDLVYYIQVILKFLKVKQKKSNNKNIMDKILKNGGQINYTSEENEENALFKVFLNSSCKSFSNSNF